MTAMTYLWRIIVILCLFAVRSNAICRQCKLCLQTGAGMGTDSDTDDSSEGDLCGTALRTFRQQLLFIYPENIQDATVPCYKVCSICVQSARVCEAGKGIPAQKHQLEKAFPGMFFIENQMPSLPKPSPCFFPLFCKGNHCCSTTLEYLPHSEQRHNSETWYPIWFTSPWNDQLASKQLYEHASCQHSTGCAYCITHSTRRTAAMTTIKPDEKFGHFFTYFAPFTDKVRFMHPPKPAYCKCIY